jgi:tetratricopeptide (TPR) repeat protein
MTIDRWSRIEEIFQRALERPPSERSDYVAWACGDDKELLSEIESLLASDADTDTTLQLLVQSSVRELAEPTSSSDAGLRIGPYRLVRELDSGGMGIVWLAVRSDNQYFQIVAIKMIRKGLEFPSLIQRFRAERQILATLTHPNIGAILDGGDTEDGRPFMVMEYVEGQPITLASETRGLSIRERLKLFQSVCSAVGYAHEKLVIHRDIKPSNVLVTPQGNVKLIDFGVSKPLAAGLIPGELPQTETWQRLMTPDYASPEQLRGGELTTTSDIYSLGVLLFELLTGSRPYMLGELSPAAAERLVCEQETRKPSSVLGLPDGVRKELSGDLDRIVLMAMDKTPSRRYPSAEQLEEDILRFLTGRPVRARKSTTLYRLNKFVRRHQAASLMACSTVVVLIGPIVLHYWQSGRRNHATQEIIKQLDSNLSPTEAANLKVARPVNASAYEDYLRGIDLYSLDQFGAAIDVLEKATALEPGYAPAWAHLGRAYATNASLQFGGREQYTKAQAAYEKAMALNPQLVEPRIYMANLWTDTGRVERAVPLLRSVLKSNPNNAEAHWELGYAFRFAGMLKESVEECEKARQYNPKVKISSSAINGYLYLGEYEKFLQSLPVSDSVYIQFYRGLAAYYMNHYDEAAREFDSAFAKNPEMLPVKVGKALSYSIKHDNARGLKLLQQTEEKIEERGVSDAESIYKVADAYAALGDKVSALHMLRHSIGGGFFCYSCFVRDPLLQSLHGTAEFQTLMNEALQRHDQFKATFF